MGWLEHERGKLAAMADRLRGRSYAECGEDETNTTWHAGYAVGWVHVRNDDGTWSEPMTEAEVQALRPERSESEWRRLEHLEATVGRRHEAAMP